MSDDFFRTSMGRRFYEHDVPRIADSLAAIAERLERPFVEQVWLVRRGEDLAVYASEQGCSEALAEDGVDVGAWDGQRAIAVGNVYVFTKIVAPSSRRRFHGRASHT